jgi:flagellar assembly protein FliH
MTVNSSSSGVLRQPFIANDPHVMGSADTFYVDPVTAKRSEDARKAGYQQGFADGAKAAETAARRSAEVAAQRLRDAAAQVVAELASTTADLVPALMDTAIAIAHHLVASVPEELTASLVERLSAALDQIDDDRLVIHISPGDQGEVQAGFGAAPTVTLALDPTLGAGEARIEGTWARADLTLPAAWSLIEESLRG